MRTLTLLLILSLLLPLVSQAQVPRDSAGFRAGIYGGYYIPGNAPARYYAATDNDRLEDYLAIAQNYARIKEVLGNYDFTLAETAQDMVYNNAFAFELSAEFLFRKNWYMAVRFMNTKLTATGIFTLDVQRPNQGSGFPNNLEQVNIGGTETRSHIDLGAGKQIPVGENLYMVIEGGFDLNFVEVTSNEFVIEDEVFVLPTYSDPLNPQATPGNTVGTGYYVVGGIGYELPSTYGFWLKFNFQQTNISVNRTVEDFSPIFTPSLGFTKYF